MTAPLYNASDPKDIRRAAKASAADDAERISFIKSSMSTIGGRAWFYNFLSACHLFDSAPTFDPNRDYFALGERNVGLRTFTDILSHCPDLYIVMMQEAHIKELTNVRRSNDDHDSTDHSGTAAYGQRSGSSGRDGDSALSAINDYIGYVDDVVDDND